LFIGISFLCDTKGCEQKVKIKVTKRGGKDNKKPRKNEAIVDIIRINAFVYLFVRKATLFLLAKAIKPKAKINSVEGSGTEV